MTTTTQLPINLTFLPQPGVRIYQAVPPDVRTIVVTSPFGTYWVTLQPPLAGVAYRTIEEVRRYD